MFNNSNRALDQNSDAAAHTLITLAQSTIPDRAAPAPAPTALRQASAGMHGSELPEPLELDAADK